MTDTQADSAEKKESRKRRGGLYVTDAEIIERLGVPEKIARDAIHALDADPRSGFPRKQKLWGERRYWPAVQSYFDAINGQVGAARLIPENRVPHSAAASSTMRSSTRRGYGTSS